MLEVAIMLEGQNGLTWPRWKNIVRLVEELGFAGLYRSDHFTNMNPPDQASLELWVSLTWLADNTKRIEFGPLVAPLSFRHPALLARMASAVDDLSDGRLILGLGSGWQEREHRLFGFDLLEPAPRFDRFEEGLQVITQLLKSDSPVSFAGTYYQLREAIMLPRPLRPGGPRILIGGNGPTRTPDLVARYADEWNAPFTMLADFKRYNARLDSILKGKGRDPKSVKRSLSVNCTFSETDAALKQKLTARNHTAEQLRSGGAIVGTSSTIKEQLHELEEAGVGRVMLQWLELDDLADLEALAKAAL
jgi:F420-dependent oxidoreductase-like protein